MLETTLRKRLLRWFDHVPRMEDYRRAKLALHHVLPGKTPSGETANRWTRHGMTSISRHQTEMTAKNELSGVLVTERTRV